MASVGIKKRGKVYQYQFEIAPVKGQRKWITKSGFKTKAEAQKDFTNVPTPHEIVDTLFLNIFANDYFSMIKNRVTQKSTRREFEFDYKELAKTLFTLPDIEIQKRDAQIVNKFYFKLQKEKDILELYKKQKAYLLKNMFI